MLGTATHSYLAQNLGLFHCEEASVLPVNSKLKEEKEKLGIRGTIYTTPYISSIRSLLSFQIFVYVIQPVDNKHEAYSCYPINQAVETGASPTEHPVSGNMYEKPLVFNAAPTNT